MKRFAAAFLAIVMVILASSCGGGGNGEFSVEKVWSESRTCSPFAAITVYGDYLYASAGQAGIYVYSLANPAKPAYLTDFYYDASSNASAGQAEGYDGLAVATKAASGSIAAHPILVASSSKGLDEISLADPANPIGAGFEVYNSSGFPYTKVAAAGSVVAACPAAPDETHSKSLVGAYSLSSGSWAGGEVLYNRASVTAYQGVDAAAYVSGGRSYACSIVKQTLSGAGTGNKGPKLYLVDTTDGVFFSNYPHDFAAQLGEDGSAKGFVTASDSALVAVAAGGIHKATVVASTASGSSNGILATVATTACDSSSATALAVDGATAYVLYSGKLSAYDVSGKPALKGSASIDLPAGYKAFVAAKGCLYSGGSSGLVVYQAD